MSERDMKNKRDGVHLSHCYQGENENNCKYGDEDCPAKKHYAGWVGTWLQAFEEEAGYMTQKDKCPDCKGTGMGQFNHNKNAPCDTCNGTGEKDKLREKISTIISEELPITVSDEMWEGMLDRILPLFIADKKSIERIAEELGVNFHDLYPYILMTEKEAKKQSDELILEMRREYEQKLTLAKEVAKTQERIDTAIELEIWMNDESAPYRRIAMVEHAISKLKRGQVLGEK